MKELFVAILIVAVIAALIYLPLGFIWSINTLFPSLAIPYTFKTWCASMLLMTIFSASKISYNKQ